MYHAVLQENNALVAAPSDGEAPTLLDLYGLYAHIFEACPPPMPPLLTAEQQQKQQPQPQQDRGGVVGLLFVLIVAQEPLPLALLQQMGLDKQLESLPGFGSLFYVSEHRVYMLHKSVSDWLHEAVVVVRGDL